jgi:hypothetical protein
LIPLVSKLENQAEFIEEACSGVKEIILLLVIDTEAMQGEFGFASKEIMQGNKLMEEVKALVGQKRKTAKDIIEWGGTLKKIENIAILQQVDKVILKGLDNPYFQQLVDDLKADLKNEKITVQVI